jgi:hypothetical protein
MKGLDSSSNMLNTVQEGGGNKEINPFTVIGGEIKYEK